MTDIVQARESAIAAETSIETLFDSALDQLHKLNDRLLELHDAIKAAQPVAPGSVCLELYPCGPGCTGCPHPRWVIYQWSAPKGNRPGLLQGYNLGAQNRDPVLVLARKAPHYQATATLIREAKSILAERTALLTAIRTLRTAIK